MTKNINKQVIYIVFGLLLSGCVVSNQKFFLNTQSTDDPSYGYTKENPISIKNAGLNSSIGSSYYYLSRLRTKDGDKLKLVRRYSVSNPNYKKPAVPINNRYTGQPLIYGTGPRLDYYILKPEKGDTTIELYINPYLKSEVKIPVGLEFEKQ